MTRIITVILVAGVTANLLGALAAADTIGYWRFEEGSAGGVATGAGSVLDSSAPNPASNPGNPNGGPSYSSDVPVSLVLGNANALSLLLNGVDNNVLVPTDAALNSAADFTVEFWMRSGNLSNDLQLLVDKSHGFGDETGWFFQSGLDGAVVFGIGDAGGGSFPGVASLENLYDSQWHHLAGTYDGSEIELFVDGASQGTNAVGTYQPNTRDIRFGNARNNGRFFGGNLDEVRISDRVLDRSQFLLAVPEPSSVLLGVATLTALGLRRQRRP